MGKLFFTVNAEFQLYFLLPYVRMLLFVNLSQGTRACLQNAVKDSRALRRKLVTDFRRARTLSNMHNPRSNEKEFHEGIFDQSIEPAMMYRVLHGVDKLGFNPKCGFDGSQLGVLFPEEMSEYHKWEEVRKN